MIELLMVIIVIRQFYRSAVNLNQSVWLWMAIGACAYLVPAYLMAFLLVPAILSWFAAGFELTYYIYATLITVILALVFAFLVLKGLESAVRKKEPPRPFDQEE